MSDGMKRREFLKVLGASSAGVAATACATSSDSERLISYLVPAEEIVPGVPTWYASTCRECPAGCGIYVETHSGRVTKVEGNPDHPVSRGNLCARGQASVQGLYHPDRYRNAIEIEEGIGPRNLTWGIAERIVADRIREARPGGVVFLTSNYTGTMARLADDFVAAIGGRRLVYDPYADLPRNLEFADADFLIAFGADFLETWGSPVDYAWQFAEMHGYSNGRRGKFVWVGPHRPLTGLNADQWVAPRPGTEALLALGMTGGADLQTVARETGIEPAVIQQLAQEFRAGRGVALGPGAALAGRNASELRQAVALLNGTVGTPVPGPGTDLRQMILLTEQMLRGE
ncbi:MAG TPA: hypothetical protein VGR27_11325, partial [Longimicrobiaceae bacterium]|nr:hypothetical protein [Longimicrobiaceae bacterium]